MPTPCALASCLRPSRCVYLLWSGLPAWVPACLSVGLAVGLAGWLMQHTWGVAGNEGRRFRVWSWPPEPPVIQVSGQSKILRSTAIVFHESAPGDARLVSFRAPRDFISNLTLPSSILTARKPSAIFAQLARRTLCSFGQSLLPAQISEGRKTARRLLPSRWCSLAASIHTHSSSPPGARFSDENEPLIYPNAKQAGWKRHVQVSSTPAIACDELCLCGQRKMANSSAKNHSRLRSQASFPQEAPLPPKK